MLRDAPDKIVEPGAYRMTMDHYHGDCCAGPSVSSSGLRTIFHKSPAHFWIRAPWNPDRIDAESNPAFDFGRAAHALLLGDEDFDANFVVLPDDAPRRPSITQIEAKKPSEATLHAIAWWSAFEHEAQGRTVVSEADLRSIGGMAESLARHPAIKDYGLFQGTPEPSMIWEAAPGCWVKSRPDMLPPSGLEIGDLKTTADISRGFCERQIRTHGYDMQMALAMDGAKRTLGLDVSEAVLVFVEKSPPFCVRVVPIEEETLHYARRANDLAIKAFVEGVRSGEWPGPADDMLSYRMPQRDREEIDGRAGSTG